MAKQKSGVIINYSSMAADRVISRVVGYSVSKAAVKSLAEILQDELESISDIKVFNFDPGATRTSMRAFAYPAENPMDLKHPSTLINYYLWMFSENSNNQENSYITFSS